MCQLLWSKSVATKESLLQSILEEFHCICNLHVENVCMYWHALLVCTIHIIDAYSSTTKEHASSSIYIYMYVHLIWLQWHAKHICTLGVLIQHMAMAYATSMLPISQGALETSISTWRLLFIWYIDILYTIPRTITSWSTETLMCPCMYLICPYFAPHPPCMFLLCFSPFSCVFILYPPPCVPLVIFHVCPYFVIFHVYLYSVLFECLYLMFPTLFVPICHPFVTLLLPQVSPVLVPMCSIFFELGIGIDLVPNGHILRIFVSQGVGGGVKQKKKYIYIHVYGGGEEKTKIFFLPPVE